MVRAAEARTTTWPDLRSAGHCEVGAMRRLRFVVSVAIARALTLATAAVAFADGGGGGFPKC